MPGSVPNALTLKPALEEECVTVSAHTSLRGEWLGRGLPASRAQQVTGGGMAPSRRPQSPCAEE